MISRNSILMKVEIGGVRFGRLLESNRNMRYITIIIVGSLLLAARGFSQEQVLHHSNRIPNVPVDIKKEYAELSSKVNEQPELKKLRSELERAQRSYTEAFVAAIKKEDTELFEKYRALREEEIERFNQNRVRATPPANSSGYNQLSEEEKRQVSELRKQAMNVPAVKDAREKRNAATTDQARKAAESEYKTALRKAMLETDENLAPLLDKLEGKSNPSPSPASSSAPSK